VLSEPSAVSVTVAAVVDVPTPTMASARERRPSAALDQVQADGDEQVPGSSVTPSSGYRNMRLSLEPPGSEPSFCVAHATYRGVLLYRGASVPVEQGAARHVSGFLPGVRISSAPVTGRSLHRCGTPGRVASVLLIVTLASRPPPASLTLCVTGH
jgi:hypothetical protein